MPGWETGPHERAAELELVRDCAAGDLDAWRRFEQVYVPNLQQGAARVRSDPEFVAEVVQELRDALFAGPAPKALSFSGKGPLGAWLKVVATRAALDKTRGQRRRQSNQRIAQLMAADGSSGLESRLDRQRLGDPIVAALRAALCALEPRERNLLRLRYASGLNVEAIALAYAVHRATVARWLAHAHQQIAGAVRLHLEQQAKGQSHSELDAALRALDSRLASALASFLGASATERERG